MLDDPTTAQLLGIRSAIKKALKFVPTKGFQEVNNLNGISTRHVRDLILNFEDCDWEYPKLGGASFDRYSSYSGFDKFMLSPYNFLACLISETLQRI